MRTSAYIANEQHIDLDSEIRRLQNQVNLTWQKEARNLINFGLKDEMSVLEIGSGPGFYTELLSDIVPNGSITGVEIDPSLVEYSQQYLKDKVHCQHSVIQGSVMKIDFPDNSFDFAVARLVFEHLPDQISAAKEILRVLKPGGKLVLIDFDFGIPPVSYPIVPEAEVIREKSKNAFMAIGGDPLAGRRLWSMLKGSGFQNLDIEALVLHSGKQGILSCYPQFDPERVLPLVEEGLVSEAELQSYRAGIETFMSSQDPFFIRVLLMACGEKA
jgi:ubiquinone/menaquinone biosynthesis C-methylase UbiE